MATKLYYDGKVGRIPDIYTRMKSGIVNPPVDSDYGKVLVIDTGSMSKYGSGSGVNGTKAKGIDSLYRNVVDTPQAMRDFVKGGLWYGLSEPLFRPFGGNKGVSGVDFIRACTTTPAEASYAFTGGGGNGGTISFSTNDEGINANGVEVSSTLTRGFGVVMKADPDASSRYMLEFYSGSFKGINSGGVPYDGILESESQPNLLLITDSFDNIADLHNYLLSNKQFNKLFEVKDYTISGNGSVDGTDLTNNASMKLFAGGTEAYNPSDLDDVFESIRSLPYNFIFSDKFGTEAVGTENTKVLYHLLSEAKHGHIMFVSAFGDETKFNDSLLVPEYFDSERVVVVHGDAKVSNTKAPTGFDSLPVIYKTAYVLGRLAGLEPQVPITFKEIGISGEEHKLKYKQKVSALDKGLLVTVDDEEFEGRVVLQGVNSLQDNEYLINGDAQSHSIQIVRIKDVLNYDIYYNAKRTLFGNPKGTNRNTLSEADVKTWLESFLKTKIATKDEDGDNLIIKYQNVTVERKGDSYHAQYEFEPNGEINKMLITGVIID